MSSGQQLVPWLRCRHLLEEYGDDIDNILCEYKTDILQIVGGIGVLLKQFLKQKPGNLSNDLLNNLWNLLSSTKHKSLRYDSASLLSLPDDVLSSICTYLNLNDLNNLNQVCYITSIAVRIPVSHKLAVSQINPIHYKLKDHSKQIILSPFQSQQFDAISSFQSIFNQNKQNKDDTFDTSIYSAINIGIPSRLTQCIINNKYDQHFRFEASQLLCDLLSVDSVYFYKILTNEMMQRLNEIIIMKYGYNEDIVGIIIKQIDSLITKDCSFVINCNILSFICQWIQCLVKMQYDKYEKSVMNIMKTLIISGKQDLFKFTLQNNINKKSVCNTLCKLINTVNCRIETCKYDAFYYNLRDDTLKFVLYIIENTKHEMISFLLNAECIQYVLSVIHELNRTDRDIHDMHLFGVCVQIINSILIHSNDENDENHDTKTQNINNRSWATLLSVDNIPMDGSQDVVEITNNSFSIGKSEDNDLKLPHLDDIHCRLMRDVENDEIYLIDLSDDGIYIENELIGKGNRGKLDNGCKIILVSASSWNNKHNEIAYILYLNRMKEFYNYSHNEVTQQLMTWSYSKQIRSYIDRDSIGSYILLSFALMLRYSGFIDKILDNDSNDTKGLIDEIIDIIIGQKNEKHIKNGALCIFNIIEYGNDINLKILNENHGVMAALFGLMDIETQRDQKLMINGLHSIDILMETQIMRNGSNNYSQRIYKRKLQKLKYELIDDNTDNQFVPSDPLKLCIEKLCEKYDTDA